MNDEIKKKDEISQLNQPSYKLMRRSNYFRIGLGLFIAISMAGHLFNVIQFLN